MKFPVTTTLILFLTLFSFHTTTAQCFSEQTYNTTGNYIFDVPGDVTVTYVIEVEAKGADGAPYLLGGNPIFEGGQGATMTARFEVNGGDMLRIMVGEAGNTGGSPSGGGGGGGTAVTINDSDVLIAAGAGGGGGNATGLGYGGLADTDSPPEGGAGPGASGGGGFNDPGDNGVVGTGGGAGTLTSMGAGGTGGVVAGNGGEGFGGGGGGAGTAGGGGGGYQGGDGADDADLGGHGGNSYVNPGFSSMVIETTPGIDGGSNSEDGYVVITCITDPMGDPLMLTVVGSQGPDCLGGENGQIEVSATGGMPPYTYSIDGGPFSSENVFDGLSAGTYTIQVMDALGNTDEAEVTLDEPADPIQMTSEVTDNTCFGDAEGTITATASGGAPPYTYSIDGGPQQSSGTFGGLANGVYTVMAFDVNGCEISESLEIQSPAELIISIDEIQNASCYGSADGSISISASGGTPPYQFSLDGGPFDASGMYFNLAAGSYFLQVQDANGCTNETTVFIDEAAEIAISIDVTQNVTCYGEADGVLNVNASEGISPYEYSLDGLNYQSSNTFTALSAGTYQIFVIDANSCVATTEFELTEPPLLAISTDSTSDVSCDGSSAGAIYLSALGGTAPITYSLNGGPGSGSGVFIGLVPGTYTVEAVDANGCSDSDTIIINAPDSVFITVSTTADVTCGGASDGSISANVTGGNAPFTYYVNGEPVTSDGIFNDLSGGTYSIKVVDNSGCADSVLVTISEPAILYIDSLSVSNVLCHGEDNGTVIITAVGGTAPYQYTLNDTITSGDGSFSGLAAGLYSVALYDTNGCFVPDTILISEPSPLLPQLDTVIPANCPSGTLGSVQLSANGGTGPYTFMLNNEVSDGSFDSLAAGNYVAVITDVNDCATTLEFIIEQVGGIAIDTVTVSHISCYGLSDGSIEITPQNTGSEYTYTLLGESNMSGIFENLGPGNYSVGIADDQSCEAFVNFLVIEPDSLWLDVIEFIADDGSMNGQITVEAIGGTPPFEYSIDNGVSYQTEAIFSGLSNQSYVILVRDANGCLAEVQVVLTGSKNILPDSDISVFPNPASQQLNVVLTQTGAEMTGFQVMDLHGRDISNQVRVQVNMDRLLINTGNLSEGTYIIRIDTAEGIVIGKFVVMH